MRDYEKELGALREQTARLRQNGSGWRHCTPRRRRPRRRRSVSAGRGNKEQKDVEDLDRLTFSGLWANLSGRKAEKLEKEEAEAFAAR